MAKQKLMQDLDQATRQLANQVKLAAVAVQVDTSDYRKVLKAAEGITLVGKSLDQRKKAAEAHIRTWDNESRWKRAKNVAIPNLTAGRKQLRDMVDAVSVTLNEAGTLLVHYRSFADELSKSMSKR